MNKKILISVPETLLDKIDSAKNGISRSEFIRNAISKELSALEKEKLYEELKKGYMSMGEINLSLAEEGILADNEQLLTYEQKLSESE